jgi:hypothetical protein
MKPIKLVNAQEMARQHPDTFEVPSRAALSELREGDLVKVSNNAERFWLQIVARHGNVFVGRVDNLLLFGRVNYGDHIEFQACNVYDIQSAPR